MKNINKAYVSELFTYLQDGKREQFFAKVSDNAVWEVLGTHPIAGKYLNTKDFITATFARLDKCLKSISLHLKNVLVDQNYAAVEITSTGIANNNESYNNIYCWIIELNPDGFIISVRIYTDSVLVQRLIDENEI